MVWLVAQVSVEEEITNTVLNIWLAEADNEEDGGVRRTNPGDNDNNMPIRRVNSTHSCARETNEFRSFLTFPY